MTAHSQDPTAPKIDGLQILGVLGRGGMGVVYRARDEATGREVALKVVLGEAPSAAQLDRFQREGQLTAALDHPGIVRVHSAGVVGTTPYIVYEMIEGARELRTLLPTLPIVRRVELIRDTATALGYTHAHGVVHRDVKPENVLVDGAGRARVADFGLAFDAELERITATQTILGTPLYMPPEQLAARRDLMGPASDVWSLGVVLYEALTGEVPFDANTLVELHAMLTQGEVVSVREIAPEVHPDLEAIVTCCLRHDPAARYPTCSELAADLDAYLAGAAVRARRPGRPLLRWAFAAALVVGAVAVSTSPPSSSSPPVDDARGLAPWGPLESGWSHVWTLEDGAPAHGDPALWAEPFRVAAPIDRVLTGDAKALAAAYPWGDATATDGLVEVSYTELARASRDVSRVPGELLARYPPDALRVDGTGAEVELRCPNDAGQVTRRVGDARWGRPRLACAVRPAGPGDMRRFGLWMGVNEPERQVNLNGRSGRIGADGASAPFELPPEGVRLTFAPGAAHGQRLLFDDRWVEEVEAGLADPCERGDVGYWVSEHHVKVSGFTVAGVPLRPDASALAWAPPRLGASVRVLAAFERAPSDADGGPALALGTDPVSALTLELRGEWLVLRHGAQSLARVEVGPAPRAGWMELARHADLVYGSVHFAERTHSVEVHDPRPMPYTKAGFGSTAPRVTFSRVEVARGPPEPERDAFDRRDDSPGATTLTSSWRASAWRLLQLTTLEHADLERVGPNGVAARKVEAQQLVTALLAVADDPAAGALGPDARARVVLAAVLGGEGAAAETATVELVEQFGRPGARATIDALSWLGERPHGLVRLKAGWLSRTSEPEAQEAALRSHDVLVPEDTEVPLRRAQARIVQARSVPPGVNRKKLLRRALQLCGDARERGAEDGAVLGVESECFLELGRFAEAVVAWRGVVATRASWYACMQLAVCLLQTGDAKGAVEAALRGLAATVRAPKQGLLRALSVAAQRCEQSAPAHAAVAYQALDDLGAGPGDGRHREFAKAALATADGVGIDLALYVETRAGRRDVILPLGERPTGALGRAHRLLASGELDEARALLAEATKQSRLVNSLARIDPSLAKVAPPR